MEFIKNLTDKLSKVAEATTKKAGELTDTAKLKIKISRLNGEINEAYSEIGKLIYKQYKDASDESAAIAEKCLGIDKKSAEITSINAEIEAIKAAVAATEETNEEDAPVATAPSVCPCCGTELPIGAFYCCKCGQKQE